MFLLQPPMATKTSETSAPTTRSHAADGDETVDTLAADHRLDRIGDDFARHERKAHARLAHRDAVGHGNSIEENALRPSRIDARRGFPRELPDVHVAGGEVRPGG